MASNDVRREWLYVIAFLAALTIIVTWPQARYMGTQVADHDDPFLSMWRLGWVAHALRGDVAHLFDGNIFYPHARTLAFSDATLLEGLLAAPWLWAHVSPVLVYNVLLLAGFVSSGAGMFVLIKYLTASADAALVGAAIFTVAPYRIEHFAHLELQWTAWMPLTLWAVHRTFDTRSIRYGVGAGLLLALQGLSCLYYGAYLAIIASMLAVSLAVVQPRLAGATAARLLAGAVVAAAIIGPYAWPYVQNSRVLGARDPAEIANFSARVSSYFAAPTQNWFWGWTGWAFSGNELRLFPGVVAIGLAIAGAAQRRRPVAWIYAGLALLAVNLSLGLNSALYRWLLARVWVFAAFRAPARFAILACCCLAVVAAFGFDRLRHVAAPRFRAALLVTVLVAIALEAGSSPMLLSRVPARVPPLYTFLAKVDRGVVVELPIVDSGFSPVYMFWSTRHWNPLVNGYSGFIPADYRQTLTDLAKFPDARSIDRLRQLDVRYVLIHESFYPPRQLTRLLLAVAHQPQLTAMGRFDDWVGPTQVMQLIPAAAGPMAAR